MGFNVIIEANDGDDFMNQIQNESVPNVCILDIDTPIIQEFVTAKKIKEQYPDIKILAYTLFEMNYRRIEEYGIDLFLRKSCSLADLKTKIMSLVRVE